MGDPQYTERGANLTSEGKTPEIRTVVEGASGAVIAMRDVDDPVDRPAILRTIAVAADAARAEILATCSEETALTPDELGPEFDRMTGTLRMFADLVEEGTWVRAAIDLSEPPAEAGGARPLAPGTNPKRLPASVIGPNHDLRSMLVPLGPVAVFGASNFPLAYGVLGGDTASALAAGCPVIVKEHPAHPRTGRLLTRVAADSYRASIPKTALLQYIIDPGDDNSVGTALVRHHDVAAVGFTGSRVGGLALDLVARQRTIPVPVFAEMGSANRVFICSNALTSRGPEIARELAVAILSRHGQQCTKPGLIFLEQNPGAKAAFVAELARALDAAQPRRMLSARISDEYSRRCATIRATPSMTLVTSRKEPGVTVGSEHYTVPMLFGALSPSDDHDNLDRISGRQRFGVVTALTDEVFGPAAVVFASDGFDNEFFINNKALVSTIYADPDDLDNLNDWELRVALRSSGRLAFNSPTTGVRVATAQVHGGPFPATNRPDTTAVGPRAIERWCRAVCFQNCPDALLPPELQNANPRGILRTVNGMPTRDAIV
jgi:alpha-ketoglutaric semialdehyde dehydrogenase